LADEEKFEDIAKKNSKFHHWFRLLYEVIWLFGDELKPEQKIYHGLSFQPMFDKLEYNFNAPLSTTTDLNVAMDFCNKSLNNNGVILELVNGESMAQPYLSMERFSKFPEEKEYLFFGPTLQIKNIYTLQPETSEYTHFENTMDVYNFYLKLLNGNDVSRMTMKKLKWCCKFG